MFKNERHIKIQQIAAPEASRDISDQMLSEILTPQFFETLDSEWSQRSIREFPDHALLPHVLGRSVNGLLSPDEIERQKKKLLDSLTTGVPGYPSERVLGRTSACAGALMLQYLLKQINPHVPSALTEKEWTWMDKVQQQLVEQNNMIDYVYIEAWRKLVDRTRPPLSDELVQKTLDTLDSWRTEQRKKLSDTVVRPKLRMLLFGLKILAPEHYPTDLTIAEQRLVTVEYPQPKTVPTTSDADKYMLILRRLKEDYAISLVLASPKVRVDEKGLHVELSAESAPQQGKPPTPLAI